LTISASSAVLKTNEMMPCAVAVRRMVLSVMPTSETARSSRSRTRSTRSPNSRHSRAGRRWETASRRVGRRGNNHARNATQMWCAPPPTTVRSLPSPVPARLSNGAGSSDRCSNDPNVNQHLTLSQIVKRPVLSRMCFALSRCNSISVSLYNLRLFGTPIQSANEMTSIS
jgi:hypothetical protein